MCIRIDSEDVELRCVTEMDGRLCFSKKESSSFLRRYGKLHEWGYDVKTEYILLLEYI